MSEQIIRTLKPWAFEIIVLTSALSFGIFCAWLVIMTNDFQEEKFAEIDKMSCGELKEYIFNEGWKDYNMREDNISQHATHVYTWGCEK